jgi:hypothetical protein
MGDRKGGEKSNCIPTSECELSLLSEDGNKGEVETTKCPQSSKDMTGGLIYAGD